MISEFRIKISIQKLVDRNLNLIWIFMPFFIVDFLCSIIFLLLILAHYFYYGFFLSKYFAHINPMMFHFDFNHIFHHAQASVAHFLFYFFSFIKIFIQQLEMKIIIIIIKVHSPIVNVLNSIFWDGIL